jgi:hypothetical protein
MKSYYVNQSGIKQSIAIQSPLDGISHDALAVSFPRSAWEDEAAQS